MTSVQLQRDYNATILIVTPPDSRETIDHMFSNFSFLQNYEILIITFTLRNESLKNIRQIKREHLLRNIPSSNIPLILCYSKKEFAVLYKY